MPNALSYIAGKHMTCTFVPCMSHHQPCHTKCAGSPDAHRWRGTVSALCANNHVQRSYSQCFTPAFRRRTGSPVRWRGMGRHTALGCCNPRGGLCVRQVLWYACPPQQPLSFCPSGKNPIGVPYSFLYRVSRGDTRSRKRNRSRQEHTFSRLPRRQLVLRDMLLKIGQLSDYCCIIVVFSPHASTRLSAHRARLWHRRAGNVLQVLLVCV